MNRLAKTLTGVASASLLALGLAAPAQAFNNTASVYLPNTNIKLTAYAYSPNIVSGGRFWFATSSKSTVNGAAKRVGTIRNTATLEARGVNASIGIPWAVSVTGDKNTKSISWTNNNAWISDLDGSATYGGLTISVHANSAAFALHNGVKRYVDVWSW